MNSMIQISLVNPVNHETIATFPIQAVPQEGNFIAYRTPEKLTEYKVQYVKYDILEVLGRYVTTIKVYVSKLSER